MVAQFTCILFGFLCFSLRSFAAGLLQNTTIDDADSLIVYTPPLVWKAGSANLHGKGSQCSECQAQGIEAHRAGNVTWHEADPSDDTVTQGQLPTATLEFFGVSVFVKCIVPRNKAGPLSLGTSDMVFTIDGERRGAFYKTPGTDGDDPYEYDAVVFAHNISDTNANHTLGISPTGHNSIILLDSIVYSYYLDDDSATPVQSSVPPTSPSQIPGSTASNTPNSALQVPTSSTAKIVGGVLGSIAGLVLIGLGLLIYRRRRNGRTMLPFFFKQTPTEEPKEGADLERSYTFNPSLFVRAREIAKKASNPSLRGARRRPAPLEEELFPSNINNTRDLRGSGVPDSGALYSAGDRLLSIQSWRDQAQREIASTPTPIAPLDPSEELSSYYETTEPPAEPPPRPRPTTKRWAVMNK
ncbi:hypothetical protein BDZ89DRAFT_1080665 [Hymenopellis radicata]|nr:hypothetical protein BDZ89DRAFT_1080665 [Hymenopellis radicata]